MHIMRPFGNHVSARAFEVHLVKLHVDESMLVAGHTGERPHIDPSRWKPLVMSSCRFFGLCSEMHAPRLADSEVMKSVRRNPTAVPR